MRLVFYFILTFILFFSVSYQDSHLSKVLGEIGRCPAIILLPLLIALSFKRHERVNSEAFKSIYKVFSLFLIVYTIVSIVNLLQWFTVGEQTLIYLNQNVILKSVKYGVYYLVFVLLYKYSYYFFTYRVSNKIISYSLIILIILHFFIIIVELFTIPNALMWLHSNDIYYLRVRMLTYESSWTGGVAVLLFCGAMAFSKNRISRIVCIVFILLFSLTSGSKQFLSVFPIAMFLASFKLEYKNKKWILLASVVLFILTATVLTPILVGKFTEDLEEFSSTVTRSSVFVNAFRIILFVQPLGTGGLYFYYIATELQETSQIIVDIIGFGVLHEVQQLGKDTDEFLSAGSSFAEWTLLGGYVGLVLYIILLRRVYKYAKINYWLLVGFIHFAITNTISETMVTKVNWAIFFALICTYYDRKTPKNISSIA